MFSLKHFLSIFNTKSSRALNVISFDIEAYEERLDILTEQHSHIYIISNRRHRHLENDNVTICRLDEVPMKFKKNACLIFASDLLKEDTKKPQIENGAIVCNSAAELLADDDAPLTHHKIYTPAPKKAPPVDGKAWWASLTEEQKIAYRKKKEAQK